MDSPHPEWMCDAGSVRPDYIDRVRAMLQRVNAAYRGEREVRE